MQRRLSSRRLSSSRVSPGNPSSVIVAVAHIPVKGAWLTQSKNLDFLLLAGCSFLLALFCHSLVNHPLFLPTANKPAIEQIRPSLP
ncbi:hypothetical protein BST81_17585 [Leptolyngbya sp. 'hensonii']|nr:hypothetical protein BST81_17585 [Leptolyngbya sp. 'hensonii']